MVLLLCNIKQDTMNKLSIYAALLLVEQVNKEIEEYPCIRLGQSWFNNVSSFGETNEGAELTEKVLATESDPFHNNKRLPSFFSEVFDNEACAYLRTVYPNIF